MALKPHPSEKIYNTNITAKKLFDTIIKKSVQYKALLDSQYNINKFSDYISSVISFGGSAGYEYTN